MYRCHPIVSKLKSLLTERPVGDVLSVNAVFTAPTIDRFNKRCGGSTLDLGCYPISLPRFLFGEPISVEGEAEIIGVSEEEKSKGLCPFDRTNSIYDISRRNYLQYTDM